VIEKKEKVVIVSQQGLNKKIKRIFGYSRPVSRFVRKLFFVSSALELVPESIRPDSKKTFTSYEGINNLFNFVYEILAWKVHRD
jgi:hypothetical protein